MSQFHDTNNSPELDVNRLSPENLVMNDGSPKQARK